MTAGSSRLWRPASLYLLHPCSRMLAMIRTAPPQCSQVSSGTSLCPTASRQSATVQIGCPADLSISIRNTRLRRCAQIMAWRGSGSATAAPDNLTALTDTDGSTVGELLQVGEIASGDVRAIAKDATSGNEFLNVTLP